MARLFAKMFFLSMVLLIAAGCTGGRARWISGTDHDAFGRMINEARGTRVIFVGEFHDQREHHDLQLRVIKALRQAGLSVVIGLEMFDMESQDVLDRWSRKEIELEKFVARYRQEWSIPWAEYDTILLYARNNMIPLVALNAPDDLVSKVSHHGFASVGPKERLRLPPRVTGETSATYRSFLRDAFAGHRLDEIAFASFCEAQGLRNNTMHRLISDYLSKHPGTVMVVITGVGHAMRRAVADNLDKAGVPTKVIIPVVEGLFDEIDRDDADYFVSP